MHSTRGWVSSEDGQDVAAAWPVRPGGGGPTSRAVGSPSGRNLVQVLPGVPPSPTGDRVPGDHQRMRGEFAVTDWSVTQSRKGIIVAKSWLDVPYSEKDDAKALGARWDPGVKRWYAPPGREAALVRWAALPDIPQVLVGEDRSFGTGLFVDLVPSSCWFTNVRSCVAARDWERLRRMIIARAGGVCESCGRSPGTEAHERWHYDDDRGVQSLRRLILVCGPCHEVTHMGLADLRGRGTIARRHLQAVTGWSDQVVVTHIAQAFALWQERSARVCGALPL